MTAPDYRARMIPVRGGELAVGSWGPEDGPTILAVHGVTASHMTWPFLSQALPGVRIIAPDLRGRGRSNRLPGPYGMPSHADDLAAVLDAFGVDRAVVVGHSMGGFASVVFAHRHPERVAELVLVDGGLPLTVPEGMSDADFTRAVLGPAQERLSMTFPTRAAYVEFWKEHPAFADDLNDVVLDYIDYDLDGSEPELRPSTSYQAVAEDSAELSGSDSVMSALTGMTHDATFLRAPRGLMNAAPLYTSEQVAGWAERFGRISTLEVDDVNHYTIVLGSRGAREVAAVVQDALDRAEKKAGV